MRDETSLAVVDQLEETRLSDLRDRITECISLARDTAAVRREESRSMKQLLALLFAAMDSLDHHERLSALRSVR